MEIAILSVETEISTYLSLKGKKFVPQMHPPNMRIWRYRLVWHSRTPWGKKLCMRLTSVTQETTKQIAFVKSGANSLLIFTKTNFLFVSCVAEPNPCTVFYPTRSLNVGSIHGSCRSVYRGAFGNQSFLTFCRKWAVWATGALDPRSFLSIIIVILTLMLTLYFPPFP